MFVSLAAAHVYAFDEIKYPEAGICRDLGVLRGGISGVDDAYLADTTTRLQAMFITIRLIGKESVASTYVWTDNFNDAYLADFESGRNLLAYVKSHPELGWQGDPFGYINPTGYMTAQSMYKVLLSVLGYKINEDFSWDGAIAFAGSIGMRALSLKYGNLTNGDIAIMVVEALKTRKKDSEDTLCEHLVSLGVISPGAAYMTAMLPGSFGYQPLLTYNNGGPLLAETKLDAEKKAVSIKFNTALNPTYAKSLKNYNYYMPGTGYMPLPARCSTSMADEYTVVIHFPSEGWISYNNNTETDAFLTFIASDRANELRVSGLYDVDGNLLRDIYVDVPSPQTYNAAANAGAGMGGGAGAGALGGGAYGDSGGTLVTGHGGAGSVAARTPSQFLR